MSTENRTAQDFSLLKSFRAASLVGMGKWGGEKHCFDFDFDFIVYWKDRYKKWNF